MGELNKIVGGFCGALLILLGLSFFGEKIFHPHHSEELAFALEIEDAGGEEEEEEVIDFAAIFAAADASAGESVFKKCQACHVVADGENKTGPHLWDIVNRPINAIEGFRYSGALPGDQVWSPENLYRFLEAPKKWAPGTSMGFNGLRKSEDRANLIAWLNEADGTPEPLE
ncbi:MAG: cytochrome c family protein [Pseudomonadota bacterium]